MPESGRNREVVFPDPADLQADVTAGSGAESPVLPQAFHNHLGKWRLKIRSLSSPGNVNMRLR